MLSRHSRGDTIVEVIVAFTVFSVVAVGTVTVMNRGVSAAERSLETTLVRQQIDAQAELLRYARSVDSPAWDSVKANLVVSPPAIDRTSCPATAPSNSFILSTDTTAPAVVEYFNMSADPSIYTEALVHSQFSIGSTPVAASGFWVVAVRADTTSTATAADAYDMYINACWYPPGNEDPEYLRTIVRIHDTV